MKLKTLFSTFLILFLIFSCKKEKVGGTCEYIEVQQKMKVTFIDGALNDDFTVSFQPVGTATDEVYRVVKSQFDSINRNFDIAELENRSHTFSVTIEEQTKGSCVPFVIKDIKL